MEHRRKKTTKSAARERAPENPTELETAKGFRVISSNNRTDLYPFTLDSKQRYYRRASYHPNHDALTSIK
jgi:hypothetical protein